MNSLERKAKLAEIQSHSPEAVNALKLPYQGETRAFNVYKIPLEFLVFNKDNGRIASLVKSYIREHQAIDVETEEGSALIAKFLYSAHEDRNKITREDIINNGQLQYGIVTSDGVIVDGNRRVTLLISIANDPKVQQSIRDRSKFFLAAILPEEANPKDILRLETQFQMGADGKVDYNPIEKYLHAVDMLNKGFTVNEIKSYMGFKKLTDVTQAIEIVKLMDEYLAAYDYEGIYTQIPSGAEDRLLKLNDAIKKIKEGGIPWIPTDGKDEVITDLKTICFDFIRLGEHNQEEYRAIMQGNYSFLANEAIWRQFVKSYFDKVDEVPEETSTEEVLETSKSDEDSTRLLRARDNKWKSTVKEVVSEAYTESKISLENNKDKDEPLKLLKKAINALSSINHETIRTAENKAELVQKVEEILELIKGIKKDIE
jgi:hypothetical protein